MDRFEGLWSKRGSCVRAIVLAALIIGSAVFAFLPGATAQSAGQLWPPYSDFGFDTDSPPDGLFNYLVVNASVNVTSAGQFFLWTELYDVSGSILITDSFNDTLLNTGIQEIPVWFIGFSIRSSAIDGPYLVSFYLLDDSFSLIDTDTYVTGAYLAEDFQLPPAEFLPPHSDYGLNTDGDAPYEYLVVDVIVNVTQAGSYSVDATLLDQTGMFFIAMVSSYNFLDPGQHTVELKFQGFEIYSSGIDGPYMVGLELRDDDFNLVDNDTHMTNAYLFTDFEQIPPAEFSPPHSDYGLDTDGDTLYNYLVVDAVLSVDMPGTYSIDAMLFDITGMTIIDWASNDTFLDAGIQTAELVFSGYAIRLSGIDGPYMVRLFLYDEEGYSLDAGIHMSNPYLYTEFQSPPGEFSPPHSDYGLDRDVPPDGFFNSLVVNASLDINESGMFLVSAMLFDVTGSVQIIGAMNFTSLDISLQTVSLSFSGPSIYLSGIDGPYLVFMMLGVLEDGMMIPVDQDTHITNAYGYTDFQPANPAMIWGYVYDAETGSPLPSAEVQAINYTNQHMDVSSTDPSGYYEMNVFEGEFFVLTDDSDLQSNLTIVSVSGTTEVTTYLESTPPTHIPINISFSDWDNVEFRAQIGMEEDNQTMRLMIDYMFGNKDGYAQQAEIDWLAESMGEPPTMPDNTTGMFYVDSIHYDLVPGSFNYTMTGEGPVSLKTPFYLNMAGNFTSNTTIPVSPTHLIELNATYDNETEKSIFYLSIPTGYLLESFDPVANVSITGLGTSTIIVDPLDDPDPGDGIDSVWVNLTTRSDYSPPAIMNVFINDTSGAIFYLSLLPTTFNLTATLNDTFAGNSTIGGANYTTPTPTSWPGTPMSAVDSDFDEPVEEVVATILTPGLPGVYEYFVYAWDVLLNYNNSAPFATLTIVDDLPPEISNVTIDGQASVTYNLSSLPPMITLTAVVNDTSTGGANISGANYTTPGPASWPGMSMEPEDGAFDSAVENVTVEVVTPTVAGTHSFYVYGWDDGLNYNNSAPFATLTIVDDLPPEISNVRVNGQTQVVVQPGTEVTLSASVDDSGVGGSNVGGANYTIGLLNWPGVELNPSDGSFDSSQEDVNITISTTDWADGSYQICIYAWDDQPNYNTTSTQCTEVVIDGTPPEIADVSVEPDPQDVDQNVTISANVTDSEGVDVVTIEITDPQGTVLGNFSMAYESTTGKYQYVNAFGVAGGYTFRIWATDEAGNIAYESGDFQMREEAPVGLLEQFWWIILMVVIILVIIALLLAVRKKPEATEEPPEPPPPPEEEIAVEPPAEEESPPSIGPEEEPGEEV